MGGRLGAMTELTLTAEPKPDKGFTSEGILALDSPEKESIEEEEDNCHIKEQ